MNLKDSDELAAYVETLNRDFGNLREAFGDPSASLLEPVVQRFCEDLDSVSEARPDLLAKCSDLQRQLDEMVLRAEEGASFDDDVPF